MMHSEIKDQYDFVVIGSGPSGKRAAIQAAKSNKTVLMVDNRKSVGGVCLHTGTTPSKSIRETILNLSGWRERNFYGKHYSYKKDISATDIQKRLRQIVRHEVDVLEHQYDRNNVDRMTGFAKFVDTNTLSITNKDREVRCIDFDKAVIAVGTKPHRPDNIPFDGNRVVDSDEIIRLARLPRSMTIIGAGVVGLEYASIFNALGIPVKIVDHRTSVLEFMDSDIVDGFLQNLKDRGANIILGRRIAAVKTSEAASFVKLDDGRVIQSELVLYTGGRQGSTAGLGLDILGVEPIKRGLLSVNSRTFQTQASHVYAVGDVVGFPSLASTGMMQGRIAACHALDIPMSSQPDYFPYGIYTVPEMSTIGLTEKELVAKKIPYECGIARMRETTRGQIMGVETGVLKMIFSIDTQQLLGVHVLGEGATELIHIGQAVLTLGGNLDYFLNNVFNYPTLAEAYKVAALDAWNKMQHISIEAVTNATKSFEDKDNELSPLNFMPELTRQVS